MIDKSRVEFEKWFVKEFPMTTSGHLNRTTDNRYLDWFTQCLWNSWEEGRDYGRVEGNGGV